MEFHYFNGVENESDIKKQYKKLAKQYHPDKAKNDTEKDRFHKVMQDINKEHQEILTLLKYDALKPKEVKETTKNKQKSIIKETTSLFKLSKEQQDIVSNKIKDALNFTYEAIAQNIKDKLSS